jgi:ribonuclease HI
LCKIGYLTVSRTTKPPHDSPTTWSPPPNHFIKINFDGAAKGNPGAAGWGAVARDPKGELLGMFTGFLGETTNNVAELTGSLRGLQAALMKDYRNIILEGDSQVIIHLITQILNGKMPSKISPSWRLSGLLEDFKNLLTPALSIVPVHVKREANCVADRLANEAAEKENDLSRWMDETTDPPDIFNSCLDLATRDMLPPDGVSTAQTRKRGRMPGRSLNGIDRLHSSAN